jgi:hypothetical protein
LKQNRPHIINKLLIDIDISHDQQPGYQKISEEIKAGILSGIEQFGSRYRSGTDENVRRISRLSVELDVNEHDFTDLNSMVEETLMKKVKQLSRKPGKNRTEKNVFKEFTIDKQNQTLLFFFLKTGRFPWWAEKDQTVQGLEKWFVEMSADDWQKKIVPFLRKHPEAAERAAAQFSEESVYQLLKKSDQRNNLSEMMLFQEEFNSFIRSGKADLTGDQIQRIKTECMRTALKFAVNEFRGINELLKRLHTIIITSASEPGENSGNFKTWPEWLELSDGKNARKWLSIAKEIESAVKPAGSSQLREKRAGRTEMIRKSSENGVPGNDFTTSSIQDKKSEKDGYDVPQAGLVLLHPFIKQLFENLGLLADGRFADGEKKERAVCILHYLATGEEPFDEPSLALPMFLCSWPAGVPVYRFLQVSDDEKEECAKVLNSALNHWRVLKNTTPEGLRANFLHRAGRLKKGDFGWSLFVEKKTQDVLLDQLPWGISVVTFKWMKQILTINWRSDR